MTWRFHLQRALSEQWLDRDLQCTDTTINWALTGPGTLTCTVDARLANATAIDGRPLFDEWSTMIFAENDDVVRFGGILVQSDDGGNGTRKLTFDSFSAYPKGRVFTENDSFISDDAFNIVRTIWDWCQSSAPNANLNLQLDDTLSGVIIGSTSTDLDQEPVKGPNESDADFKRRYQAWADAVATLPFEWAWFNATDLGQAIDSVMSEAGGDYIEEHSWTDSDKSDVSHLIHLVSGWGGNRRDDLRFAEGENLIPAPAVTRDGMGYANYALGIGVGDGYTALKSEMYSPNDGRLRRDLVYSDKALQRQGLLDAFTKQALFTANTLEKYSQISILDHPNAPIGSWQLGDQIRIQTFSTYNPLDVWVRVTGWSLSVSGNTATITVMNLEY